MRQRLRKWWPLVKVVFTVAILVFVGRHFVRALRDLDLKERSLDAGWVALSGLLYLAGLGMSAWFWIRLLRRLGQQPPVLQAVRAYYLGHLGKYSPGKAWALLLRATLMRSPGVHVGVAGMTAFYEVLTTMASGALLAALLLGFVGVDSPSGAEVATLQSWLTMGKHDFAALDRRTLVVLSLGLLAVVGTPILPPVFNRLVHHLSLPFREATAVPPRVHWGDLAEGLLLTAGGWLLLGASLVAVLQGIAGLNPPFTADSWARYSALLSLAYVVGFVIILVPSGLGVRDYCLTLLLAPDLVAQFGLAKGEAWDVALLAAGLLRLVWTVAEVVLAGCIYWLPGPRILVRRAEISPLAPRGRGVGGEGEKPSPLTPDPSPPRGEGRRDKRANAS